MIIKRIKEKLFTNILNNMSLEQLIYLNSVIKLKIELKRINKECDKL